MFRTVYFSAMLLKESSLTRPSPALQRHEQRLIAVLIGKGRQSVGIRLAYDGIALDAAELLNRILNLTPTSTPSALRAAIRLVDQYSCRDFIVSVAHKIDIAPFVLCRRAFVRRNLAHRLAEVAQHILQLAADQIKTIVALCFCVNRLFNNDCARFFIFPRSCRRRRDRRRSGSPARRCCPR